MRRKIKRKLNKLMNKRHRGISEERRTTILNKAKQINFDEVEEVLLKHLLLEHYGLDKFSYLDLGCNNPIKEDNKTYNFYKLGCRGVCVDANPAYAAGFKKFRPQDHFIHAGVTDDIIAQEMDFHIMDNCVSSTFDPEWAAAADQHLNIKTQEVIKVKLHNINYIIEYYCRATPDLLLLDLEGLDFRVLQTLDFSKHRPKLIMINTVPRLPAKSQEVLTSSREIAKFLKPNGYRFICCNRENSIYAEQTSFRRRSWFKSV